MVSRARPRFLPALWLVVGLLLAQGLGLVHRIEHARPAGLHEAAHQAPASLLPGHEVGGAECRLVDQIGLGDGLAAALPTLAEPAPRTPWVAPSAGRAWVCQPAAAYWARAPPQLTLRA